LTSLFEKNKTAAVANAVINTAQAITSALAAPWPLSIGYAAAAAAQGYAQIRAIKSTTRSGGGGGASAASSAGAAPQAAAQQGTSSTIYLRGVGTQSLFTSDQIRDLIGEINKAQRDGVRIEMPKR
jgi:hypothetical protein